jgi:arylsulfatase A-like enzyme
MRKGLPVHVVCCWQRWTCVATAGLLAALLAVAGCGSPDGASDAAEGPPSRVFLITVDTLRADHTSAYGYPRRTTPTLERLAAEGLRFDQALCQWPKTGTSFASLFVGQYPQTTGITHEAAVRIPDGYLTLPGFYRHLGYTTLAVVSNGVLNRDLGWDRDFDEYRETWHMEGGASADPHVYRKTINAPRVNELALSLLEEHAGAEKLFVWLHYSDPHAPYVLPDGVENPFLDDEHSTQEGTVKLEKPRATALGDRRDLEYYVAQYDANVLVADRAIGEVLERLEDLGLLEDSLVIYTADHGESLGEHDYWFEHGRLPYSPGTRVPLVFWEPDLEGGRVPAGEVVERPVELVDLFPTLLALTAPEEEVPGLEGESLAPLLAGRAPEADGTAPPAFFEAGGGSPTTHWRGVQDERWKLVYHPAMPPPGRSGQAGEAGDAGEPTFELYDLLADPLETRDVKDQHRQEARRLREVLWGWMKGTDWIRREKGFVEERSDETVKALKALGYID